MVLRLRDRYVLFLWDNHWEFWTFSVLFSTLSKKLVLRFLVASIKTENALFPYKTALSEAIVKTRMGSAKWTYHKEGSFTSNCFNFSKDLFSLRAAYKNLIWRTNHPNVHIHTFRKRVLRVLFLCEYP